ncbi:MAG: cytochrome c3 family protein [Gemmatimonadota bacterium]|nr:cytochrome c3 family protein [Gemmatimonadota bacterium]
MGLYSRKHSRLTMFLLYSGLLFFALILPDSIRARKAPEVIFSHQVHLGMGIECEMCHQKAAESSSGADNLLPGEDACRECHDTGDVETCGDCHSDTLNPRALEPVVDYSPKYSHAAHLGRELKCESCHIGLSGSDSSSTEHLPAMEPCMSCHDGETADRSCIVCHEKEQGKKPADHVPESWLVEHVEPVMNDNGKSCMICHDNRSCRKCHEGEYLIPADSSLPHSDKEKQ